MIKKSILNSIKKIDNRIGGWYVKLAGERPGLIGILLHGALGSRQEIENNILDPQQQTTTDDLRRLVVYFLSLGYSFVSPKDILAGLAPDGKYAMITFDDGYYNNVSVLPLLDEFNIPATFFIATGNIKEQKCFWWDVLYRAGKRAGLSEAEIARERRQLKQKRHGEIIEYISGKFGAASWKPVGDIDRPFTPSELGDFSRHPRVFIGNHTRDHAILPNCSREEILKQFREAQADLKEMVGYYPEIVAYPNGQYSGDVISAAKEAGFALGLAVDQRKNYFPILDFNDNKFQICRFVLWGNRDIENQCLSYRYDGQLSIERAYRFLKNKINIL